MKCRLLNIFHCSHPHSGCSDHLKFPFLVVTNPLLAVQNHLKSQCSCLNIQFLPCFWCRASEPAPAVVTSWHYTKNDIIDEGGGVGWDNSVICCTFSCTCTHTSCYAAVRSHALAHIRHATPLYVLMHLHTYVMLRCCTFSCTCTHTSCYAAVRSHALAHIRHATPLYVLMHLHTYVMLRCCTFSCTCTHTSCYAAVRSHALAHIRHATLLYVLMHLHTYVMLRRCTFSCACTHTSCYAAVRSHALAHIRHATLLYVLMHLQIVGRVLGGWLWICKWWWWWWWWWWWNCSWC